MKGVDSALSQALDYLSRDWHVFPLIPKGKEPISDWKWVDECVPIEEVPYRFGDSPNNIGIGLGRLSGGLVDIDLDWPEARAIAEATKIFDDLPAFGRAGAPNSHRVAICVEARKPQRKKAEKSDLGGVKKFTLPSAMKTDPRLPPAGGHPLCVAELRGSGGYTMFPGSVHPSGEAVCWEPDLSDSLPEMSWEELERRVGLVAFLAVALRFYPAEGARIASSVHRSFSSSL